MAEDKKNSRGEVCMCPACMGGGRQGMFFLLRTLLTVLILIIVFWFGVKVGQLSVGGGERLMMTRTGYPITTYNPGGPLIRVDNATTSGM